jgi:MFS family permease
MPPQSGFIAALVGAEVIGMLGNAAFAALLPSFAAAWRLSATEAGWISGLYYAGYVAAVPLLTSLTDRIDPRRVYLASTALGCLANLGFALTAQGFWSAIGWQVLAGIGLAGTYMPGLKALTDRVSGRYQSRALATYTSGFSFGTSLSFLAAGELGPAFGWRAAFLAAAAGSALAFAIAWWAFDRPAPEEAKLVLPAPRASRLLDFRPVFANRAAMGFIVAYGCHVWELFGMRAWIVAFLTFGASLQPSGSAIWNPTWIAGAISLLGIVFSIGGNELCLRYGRRRTLSVLMLLSAASASAIGFTLALDYRLAALLCLAYGALVMADSSSLTAGAVEQSIPGYRGATMAVHSSVGFLGAFLGPIFFGAALDWAGGAKMAYSWPVAFGMLGAVVACGPLALWLLRPGRKQTRAEAS